MMDTIRVAGLINEPGPFRAWLDGKLAAGEKVGTRAFSRSCPLATFLHESGIPSARVGKLRVALETQELTSAPVILADWARGFVRTLDEMPTASPFGEVSAVEALVILDDISPRPESRQQVA